VPVERIEAVVVIADVNVVRVRRNVDRRQATLDARANGHQLARSRDGQGPEKQRVRRAEHRDVRACADCNGGNGDDGKGWTPREHTAAVAKVLPDVLDREAREVVHHEAAAPIP
jgi:hypothetical protein